MDWNHRCCTRHWPSLFIVILKCYKKPTQELHHYPVKNHHIKDLFNIYCKDHGNIPKVFSQCMSLPKNKMLYFLGKYASFKLWHKLEYNIITQQCTFFYSKNHINKTTIKRKNRNLGTSLEVEGQDVLALSGLALSHKEHSVSDVSLL